jgi:predicted ATPase/DNA-binding SARP family transcriptional activator
VPALATRLEFRILGPLEVLRDGEALEIGPRRHRALLARLLLSANRVVSAERLIEDLWAGRPPSGAAKTLRSYISRLRAVLGDEVVRSQAPGYVLEMEQDQLDAHVFEGLLTEGRSARARGDAVDAAARLRKGLALWHGGALADLAEEAFAVPEAARLEELRLQALEERIESDLECGRHQELVADLETLVSEEPLRERLWGQLMTALYRSGRQADALAAYQQARSLLAERLGLEPGEELRLLEQKILRQELEAASAPVPMHRLSSLPIQLTSFVGRERELNELTRLLSETPLVTLTGVGGCGKTRLALEAANGVLDRFQDGVLLVELAGLSRPEFVPDAVAALLGVQERSERPLPEAVVDQLRPRALLLLLDNCEHLLDACAELAAQLLGACPRLRILATSREPLGVPGERIYRVPPLSVEKLDDDAVRLFLDRATAAGWENDHGPETLAVVASICRELDGLPLALELAAARTAVLSIEEIAARLDDRFRFLRYWRRSPEPRHETLGATMAWSYELLSEEERLLLCRLSVFSGGFTLEAAAALCGDDNGDATLTMLTRLVEGSLVLTATRAGATRYGMLETVRQYAAERLAETDEEDETRSRHAAYFAGDPKDAVRFWPPDYWWIEQFRRSEVDIENLRAALDWAHETRSPLELVLAVVYQRADAVFPPEGLARVEQALANPSPNPPELRARALAAAGGLARLQGDLQSAQGFMAESLRLYRESDDRVSELVVLNRLEEVVAENGDQVDGSEPARGTEALARRMEDPAMISAALTRRAIKAMAAGDNRGAHDLLDESVAVLPLRGPVQGPAELSAAYREGDARLLLAIIEVLEGNITNALAEAEAGLEAFSELGKSYPGRWDSVDVFAAALAREGDLKTGVQLYSAVTQYREMRGEKIPWGLRHVREQTHGRLDHALGLPDFAAEAAAGRKMSLDEATATALKAAGRLSSGPDAARPPAETAPQDQAPQP